VRKRILRLKGAQDDSMFSGIGEAETA